MFGFVTSIAMVDVTKEYTFERMRKDLENIRKSYQFVDVFAVGRSVLGKDLYCVKWGCGGKRILLNGAHHGMEWITSLMLTRFIEELCYGYQMDERRFGTRLRELYNQVTFYIMPMVNPDGVNIAIKGLSRDIPSVYSDRLLRYNGSNRDFSHTWQANARGVDLNHNYNAGFEEGKQAERELGICGPNCTRYSGEHAESEPETQALVRATRMFRPHMVMAYHSQGEVIYWDYNGKAHPCAKEIGERIAELTGYALDVPDGMAGFSGYKDWVIDEMGIPAYTIEVGNGTNPLPISQIEEICKKNFKMLFQLPDAMVSVIR